MFPFRKLSFIRRFCTMHPNGVKLMKTEFGYKLPQSNSEFNGRNETIVAMSSEEYFNLLDRHYQMKIPFTDDAYYKELFKVSSQIVNNAELESWTIIDRYVLLNLDYIDKTFLLQVVEQFGKFKYFKFEFWYMIEKWVKKNIQSLTNYELAMLLYSFAHAEKGSNYLYDILIRKEIIKRGLKTFNEKEFVLIYNGFKFSKIKDKFLWAMLDKVKEELYPEIHFESEYSYSC